jgi:hypothetical protein
MGRISGVQFFEKGDKAGAVMRVAEDLDDSAVVQVQAGQQRYGAQANIFVIPFGSTPSLKTLGYKSPNEKLNIAAIGAGGRAASDISDCASENLVAPTRFPQKPPSRSTKAPPSTPTSAACSTGDRIFTQDEPGGEARDAGN